MTIVYGHSVGWANTPDEFKAKLSANKDYDLMIRQYNQGREYWAAPNKQTVRIEVNHGIVESITDVTDGTKRDTFALSGAKVVSVGRELPL